MLTTLNYIIPFESLEIVLVQDESPDQQENEYAAFEDIYNDIGNNTVEELLPEAQNRAAPQPAPNWSIQQVIVQQQPLKMPIPAFDGDTDATKL